MITKLTPEQLEPFISSVVSSFGRNELLSQVRVDKVASSWGNTISAGVGFCYAARLPDDTPAGFLLALHVDDLISGEKHAIEYLWLVTRAGRRLGLSQALFAAFEADAKTAGCYRIVAGCNSVYAREKLARWYRMRGYSIFSEAYQKVV